MDPKPDSQGLHKINPKGIREIYEPTDAQRETLKYIYQDRFIAMKNSPHRRDMEKKWDKWERAWEGFRTPRNIDQDEEWQSNHVAPVTTSAIQTAVSEMIDEEIRPFYLPQGIEKQAKATLMQHIWDYAWWTANSDLLMYDVFMDMLINGTAIVQEYYRKDKRIIQDVILGKDNEFETKEKDFYDYDDVYGEIVKLQDIWFDEKARSLEGTYGARDCIRRYIMNIDDFLLMYKDSSWDQFKNAILVKPGGDLNYYEYYKPPQGLDTSREVEVLYYWSEKPKDRLVIVANDIVIYDKPNPYKHKRLPFARAVDVKRTHLFYGKGEPELLESIQDETNTLRRMIIDRNHLDIDKMFMVSSRIGLTDEDLIARPHGMIPTDDVNGAKPVEYGDIPRSVELSLQHLEDDATIVTGINPRAQALPSASTATEAAMLKESTLKRIRLKIWLLRKEFFPRLAQLRTSNILQYYPQPRLEKIVGTAETKEYQNQIDQLQAQGLVETINGEKYTKTYRQIQVKNKKVSRDVKGNMLFTGAQGYTNFDLKPDDFVPMERGGYIIRFESGSNIEISKPLQQSKNIELYDRLAPVAMQFPQLIDIGKLNDWIIQENYDENPDDFKPDSAQGNDDADRLQMQIQLAQMENAQMMQGTPVPPTPFASPAHTRIHVTYMQSQKFQALPSDSKTIKIFTDHVVPEMMAQQQREAQGGVAPAPDSVGGQQPGQQGVPPPSAPQGQVPPPSLSNGIQNKPGGMAGPTNKLSDIMPSQQTGGNPNL